MSVNITEKTFDKESMHILLNCSNIFNDLEIPTKIGSVVRGKTGTLHRFLSDTEHYGLMIDYFLEYENDCPGIAVREKNNIIREWNNISGSSVAEATALFQSMYQKKTKRSKFSWFKK